MRIDKAVYRYIEYELFHYQQYKALVKEQRDDIIGASTPHEGKNGGSATSPTEAKAVKLMSTVGLVAMERTVHAIDAALAGLQERHRQLFEAVYVDGQRGMYGVCDKLYISQRTYERTKGELILAVGYELGVVRPGAMCK